MEISRNDFERAIMLAYKRGRVMEKELYISDADVQGAIDDLYELLGLDRNETESGNTTVINKHGDIESGPPIEGLKRNPGR